MLLFIALFVRIGAAQEGSMVQMKSALAGIPVSRAMLTDFRALAQRPATTPVSAVMQRDFPQLEAGAMVETMFARLQECQCHTVPVMRGGALVGLVTSDNIGEFLLIQAALKTRPVVTPDFPAQPVAG